MSEKPKAKTTKANLKTMNNSKESKTLDAKNLIQKNQPEKSKIIKGQEPAKTTESKSASKATESESNSKVAKSQNTASAKAKPTTKPEAPKQYITEKRLADKRFRQTEMLITEAFIQNPHASVASLARAASVSRSTFYRHHKSPTAITDDYECYLVRLFRQRIKIAPSSKHISLKSVYRDALFFILHHQRAFRILMAKNGGQSFLCIIKIIRPFFERAARMPKNTRKLFKVYASEVGVVLFLWYEKGFAETATSNVLNDIMHLSQTARTRLMPLIK